MARKKISYTNDETQPSMEGSAVPGESDIELLRESENRYRRLFETAKDGILILDAKTGMIDDVNPFLIDLLGYSREQFTDKAIWELGLFRNIVANKDHFEKLKREEYIRYADMPLETDDGRKIDVEFVSNVYLVNNRKVIQCNIRDITAHKMADKALRERERLLFAIINNFPGPLSRVDRNLRYLFVNSKYAEWFGRSSESVLGLTMPEVIGAEAFKLAEDYAKRALAGNPSTFENISKNHSGELLNVLVTYMPDINSEGKIEGFFTAVTDITKLKNAEESLRHSEEQLRQSQKMEAVGRLAGGIAHDFNNMLTVINNYAEFVIASLRPGDPLRTDVEEILKAGQRSAILTHQLLAFSRRQALEPEILDVNQIVAGIEPMLQRLIGEDVELVADLADDLGKVKADSGQIEQIIMNLAVNSRDAMKNGGKLAIGTANIELDDEYTARHLEAAPGQYVMLSVTDNGCGMNEETIEHIFEPFYTTKEPGKGTGLGLSTVYGIIKQSGGNIWVYSEPGKGTTFKIYLPREFSVAETATRAKKKDAPATGTETILVVEDEPGVLSLMKRVLEASGYTVHTAASGGEALLICERVGSSIQLIITDIVMPGIGGRELTDRLAKICPNTKTLCMSGYTEDDIVRQGVFDREINFLPKPFSLAALKNKVRKVLDG